MVDVRLSKIREFYEKWLHREADEPGVQHYYNSDLSIDSIELIIKNSLEAKANEKKERSGGVELDAIDGSIFVGSSFTSKEIGIVQKVGITHLLELQPSDIDYETGFKAGLTLGIPANTVMSVKDLEKSLHFIQDFAKTKADTDKLLVTGSLGLAKAPGLVAMWFIANGMDSDIATRYVESCREGSNIQEALFGPWHFEVAEGFLNKI